MFPGCYRHDGSSGCPSVAARVLCRISPHCCLAVPQLLARLLRSRRSEDLQAANRLIQSTIREVGTAELWGLRPGERDGTGLCNSVFDSGSSVPDLCDAAAEQG